MNTSQQLPAIDTLTVSAEEISRAAARLTQPQWKPAAQRLQQDARQAFDDDSPMPDMDAGWFDADPQRDFAETYLPFHYFIRPPTEVLTRARTLALAAMILGNPQYLQKARTLFMNIVGGLPCHVRHHDAGMQYGALAARIADLYAALEHLLDDTQRKIARDKLAQTAEATLEGTRHWLTNLPNMPYSNHLTFQRQGLLSAAIILKRDDWIAEAIDGRRGFAELLAGATFDTGLCYESSTCYHYATLGGLVAIAELVRRQPQFNRDLYRETFADGRNLKQMIDAPLDMLLPNGELAVAGDCYARRDPLWVSQADLYELAYSIYRDPKYAWLLARSSRNNIAALLHGADEIPAAATAGAAPGGKSRTWIRHGYNLLTAAQTPDEYWDEKSVAPAAFVTIDRNGIHHHADRMGLQFAAAGRVWLEDAESLAVLSQGHGFSNPVQAHFNRTTFAHNLVLIDQKSQKISHNPLRLIDFKNLPAATAAGAAASITVADLEEILYDGVAQTRSVAVTPDYLLDVYQVECDRPDRPADLLLHPRADGDATVGFAGFAGVAGVAPNGDNNTIPATGTLNFTDDDSLPKEPPYTLLRNIQSAPLSSEAARMAPTADAAADSPLTIAWQQGDARCSAQLYLLEGTPDRLFSASWPRQSDWESGGRQMLFLRASGRRITFVTLYQIKHLADENAAPWRPVAAERYFNGLHHEIRIRLTNGANQRLHIF